VNLHRIVPLLISNVHIPLCTDHCYSDNSWQWTKIVDVGSSEEFKKLPENPELYIRCPFTSVAANCRTDSASADTSHPDMFRGKPAFINQLITFSSYYQQKIAFAGLGTQVLRFSDMSLPRGGMFDIVNSSTTPWTPPHISHRTGEDADVSFRVATTGGSFIEVDQDSIDAAIIAVPGIIRYPERPGECTSGASQLCIHIDTVEQ
jgi:hypothetical protein